MHIVPDLVGEEIAQRAGPRALNEVARKTQKREAASQQGTMHRADLQSIPLEKFRLGDINTDVHARIGGERGWRRI